MPAGAKNSYGPRKRQGRLHTMIGGVLGRENSYAVQRLTNVPLIDANRPAVELGTHPLAYRRPGLLQLLREGRNGGPVVWLSLVDAPLSVPRSHIHGYGLGASSTDETYDAFIVELNGTPAALEGLRGGKLEPVFTDPEASYSVPPVEAFAKVCIEAFLVPSDKIATGCTQLLQQLMTIEEVSP